ncbi:hypothetical protein JAAARDRAFT_210009 [Jaapia argillacea MUCL 33604]|uniref:Uncharacterized protein n=1 Tax=Jaapia argillacea MUCL 33604 TaxID=933084 RepID=A0A067PEU1_9AGAM|nr:hypothetical protein JAAARDRAFT_210009 [Jaapia argillacea MUCL 33604]
MDCWKSGEIQALSSLLKLPQERMMQMFTKWGPDARLCIRATLFPTYETTLGNEASAVASQVVSNTTSLLSRLENPNTPVDSLFPLFCLRPSSADVQSTRSDGHLSIPTPHLASFVAHALLPLSREDQGEFFHQMFINPHMRSTAEWIFNAFMHTRFTSPLDDYKLVAYTFSIGFGGIPVHTVTNQLEGTLSALRAARIGDPPFYWRPAPSVNIPGIDAILWSGKSIHLVSSFPIIGKPQSMHLDEVIEPLLDLLHPSLYAEENSIWVIFTIPSSKTLERLCLSWPEVSPRWEEQVRVVFAPCWLPWSAGPDLDRYLLEAAPEFPSRIA